MSDRTKLNIMRILLGISLLALIYTNKDRISSQIMKNDENTETEVTVVETGKETYESEEGGITTVTSYKIDGALSADYSDERKPDYRIINELNTSPASIEYTWTSYEGLYYATINYSMDDGLFQYYRGLPRYYRDEDYLNYIKDPMNDQYLSMVVDNLKEIGERRGYSAGELVRETINFVQSMEYIDDDVSTEKKEWPKYPLETLYERSGDCEDFSILLAGVLAKMGYGTVLIKYDNHMAVGLKGNDGLSGAAFTHEGNTYFYIETTGTGWEIGEIPEEYSDIQATLILVN